jgi:uncharacterized protein YcfJ
MNTQKFATGLTVLALGLASMTALADPRGNGHNNRNYDDGYDYARVVDVEPIVTRVRVSTPARECWNETRYEESPYYPDRRERRSVAGSTLLGGLIGAAVGHRAGHGSRHEGGAIAAGAVIGSTIGRDIAERRVDRNRPYSQPREYTVERCEVRYQDEWQERVDAYRVTYSYHGRQGVTELPFRPGERIRVRVAVIPEG